MEDNELLGADLFGAEGAQDLADYDEYDPLAVDDAVIDPEEVDDDNPYDIVDYPMVRNMPEHLQRPAVYTPEVQGSARAAILGLFDHNPARRGVLLAIIDACREGAPTSAVAALVEEVNRDNLSVYKPTMFCRMLERAGALTLEQPPVADVAEDVDAGVEYLEITEEVDPVWTSTPDALAIYDELTDGSEFRAIVARDGGGKYRDVYKAVLALVAAAPCKREQIEALVDTFEVVQHPRRFGGHFIDMLERTDCITWHNVRWTITSLGTRMLAELEDE